jgi:hypothetical protein
LEQGGQDHPNRRTDGTVLRQGPERRRKKTKRIRDDESSVGSNTSCDTETNKKNKGKCFQKKTKGRQVRIRQTTATAKSGIPDTAVIVSMCDSDESMDSDDDGDDESLYDHDEKPKIAKKTKKKQSVGKPKGNKGRRTRKIRRNPISRRGRPGEEKPRAIIDPSAELDVV